MKKIGLSGVIGAGKSSVIQALKKEGITVLDCDAINAELLQPQQEGYAGLLEAFGSGLLKQDGEIDKQKLSDEIFADRQKKAQAEGILHPLIRQRILQELKKHEQEAFAVVEVPLLFEVGWEAFFDEVWVVACKEELLLSRLMKQRGMRLQEAKRRLAHQLPQEEKIKRADLVFWNNEDKAALERSVQAAVKEQVKSCERKG